MYYKEHQYGCDNYFYQVKRVIGYTVHDLSALLVVYCIFTCNYGFDASMKLYYTLKTKDDIMIIKIYKI
jgi:hypothetical protein